MWRGPGQDPDDSGGVGPPPSQELVDLKDQYDQQQVLIAQLKEMLRKSEQPTVTQEKVDEYASQLIKMNTRAKKSVVKKEGSELAIANKRLDTPASERTNLLRQRLEENKAKLAERGKNQKGIEDIFTQLKVQLDDSQNQMNLTPLNLSLVETKPESYTENSSSQQLYNILLNKDKRINEMSIKMQKLEANVLDLQENLKEKDSVIDARTKAITLMSENLSKKSKTSLDALDETKLQMRNMQENFVALEMQMKEENKKLNFELELKEAEIVKLKQSNDFLENMRRDLSSTNQTLQEKLDEQLELIESQKLELNSLQSLSYDQTDANHEISKLNNRIIELEELTKLQKSPVENMSELEEDPKFGDFKNKIVELERVIQEKSTKISEQEHVVDELRRKISALESGSKAISSTFDVKAENEEIAKLKKQLDENNKNMIKVKASSKSRIKELNKRVDAFKKMGDGNMEIVKLYDEKSKLTQKVAELEEEKGALQLKIMESSKDSTSVEAVRELETKLLEQANTLSLKEDLIVSLQKQIEESKSDIHDLTEKIEKLSHLENAKVKSEMTSIQFEEQMDNLELEKKSIVQEKQKLLNENNILLEQLEITRKEKAKLTTKLESYMQENIDLMDKLEKLSAEKVSSAESIEIVEGLTQQEKLELEAYQKNINISTGIKTSTENLEENPELNDSVNQLTEETSELLQKIELFTVERREVMEKMEQLTQENNHLSLKIKEVENNRDVLVETYEDLQNEKEKLDSNLEVMQTFKIDLEKKLADLSLENEELKIKIEQYQVKEAKHNEEAIKSEIISDLNSSTQLANENLIKEIEEYKTLIDIQKQEINELKVHLMDKELVRNEKLDLEAKLASLQMQYENLERENDELHSEFKRLNENIHEKDEIEAEFKSAKEQIKNLQESIFNNLREIDDYKSILEKNKNELASSANIISSLQIDVINKEKELENHKAQELHLNSVISDLHNAITKLEEENNEKAQNNKEVELMTSQVFELKRMLDENVEQVQEYEREMEANTATVNDLQKEIKMLNNKILETEHALECKDDEIKILQNERDQKEMLIEKLQKTIHQKDESFHREFEGLKQKCLILQRHVETNTSSIDDIKNPLESRINELEKKNKDQLEKMKKIAANLKKKSGAYQELEQKYSEVNEKWLVEQKEKETLKIELNKNAVLESKVQSLIEQLNEVENELSSVRRSHDAKVDEYNKLSAEYSKFNDMNLELSQQILDYKKQIGDLQNVLKEHENKIDLLSSENESLKSDATNDLNVAIGDKDEIIKNLQEQLESIQYTAQTNFNGLQMKIQELELFIETQDAELVKYKERNIKLEEGLRNVEERRMSLERTTIELGNQLEEKSNSYEEVSQTEDLLEKRLSAIIAHDQIIERRLQETTSENQDLSAQNKLITEENEELHLKIKLANDKLNEIGDYNEKLSELENETSQLKQVIATLEAEKKQLKTDYEQRLAINKHETERNDQELQNQLQLFNDARKSLIEQCENLKDQLKDYAQAQETLQNEISEYKHQLKEKESTMAVHASEYEKLSEDYKKNVYIIDELTENNKKNYNVIEDLKSQLSFEQQNKVNLTKILEQKNLIIEEYEKEKINNQMLDTSNKLEELQSIVTSLENKHSYNETKLIEAQTELQNVKQELTLVKEEKQLLESKSSELGKSLNEEMQIKNINLEMEKVEELKVQRNNLEITTARLVEENTKLENKLTMLKQEIQKHEQTNVNKENDSKTPVQFTWPGTTSDPFDFISSTSAHKERDVQHEHDVQTENSKDELLKKIKTLEFMLYNVEKERNDALLQCHELSDELTRLVYDRENEKQFTKSKALDTQQASSSSFPDVQPNLNLELEIIPDSETKFTEKDQKDLHNLEFVITKPVANPDTIDNPQPVIEETMQQRSAYLCYKPGDKQTLDCSTNTASLDTIGENDDGWAWGPEEAKLEQEHQEQVESSPHNVQFRAQINELEEKIRILERSRERHLEEIKLSQLKSGKLIKKLKEFKTKNEQLSSQVSKKSDGLDDLDNAIQEELKSQMQNLEKKIKEYNAELEKEKQEKNSVLKRIDVLTAANDRMVEMKEKQDVEILVWQQKTRELSAKLEQFEWGDGGFESPARTKEVKDMGETPSHTNAAQQQISELTDTIKDLMLDNEELQALLEEQRNLRITAEKAKSAEPILDNMKTETEYLSLLSEYDSLKSTLSAIDQEKTELEDKIKVISKARDIAMLRTVELTTQNEQLTNTNLSNQKVIDDLNDQLIVLHRETHSLQDSQHKDDKIIEELRANLDNEELRFENSTISKNLDVLNNEKQELCKQLNEKDLKIEEMGRTAFELNETINQLQQQINLYQIEVDKLKQSHEEKEKELVALKEMLNSRLEAETALSMKIDQLSEEWSQRVDQRGSDVAESWKLHLETRENEFMQIEQQLKKEINEFEEKYNGLVNENNELRKNVDTEIRNEVDRISALQQQINDRQHYINELTKLLQEKQLDMEKQQLENSSLTSRVQEMDLKIASIEDLQATIAEKEKLVEDYKHRLEDMEVIKERLVGIQEDVEKYKIKINALEEELHEKDNLIKQYSAMSNNYVQEIKEYKESYNLAQQNIKEKDVYIDDLLKKLQNQELQTEMYDNQIKSLQQDIYDNQQQTASINSQLQQSYMQIEALNQEVLNYSLVNNQLSINETEISRLKSLLAEKENEFTFALQNKSQETMIAFNEQAKELDTLKRRFAESENHYEEVLLAKDIDVENLRLQVQEQTTKIDNLLQEQNALMYVQTEFHSKTAECEELKNKLQEQNILMDEEHKQLCELREIIQEQVLKIEDLQKALYEKSRDFDALFAEIDIAQNASESRPEKHVKFADQDKKMSLDDDLTEPVSRAELDLALYMLHQRDVRCEELTVELMQLLEERDTLQLKLSNALREKENMRYKAEHRDDEVVGGKSEGDGQKTGAVSKSQTPESIFKTVGTEVASEVTENTKRSTSDQLTTKLSELRTVGYRKDKTLLDEQQLRRFQQFSIMQQHREDASRLPPEAAARLVDASYTLSRDVQSPSKVLLDWLWGRSTPKVNNI